LLLLLPLFVAAKQLAASLSPASGDEPLYLFYAHRLLHGVFAARDGNDTHFLWHGPGLPALVAPLLEVHTPIWAIRLVGPAALFAACLGMYRLLCLYLAERPALIGTFAFALYWPFYPLLSSLWSEPVCVALITWFLTALVHALRRHGTRWSILAGVLFGALALTRVEFGWVIVLLLVASAGLAALARSPETGQLLTVTATAFVVCMPWLVYTHARSGQWLYWGNSGGLSLYWAAAPYAGDLGDWHSESDVRVMPDLAPHRRFFASLPLDPVARDRKLQHQAITWIVHDPKQYVKNVVANVGRMTMNTPYSFTPQKVTSLVYSVPDSFLIAALLILGVLALRVQPAEISFEDGVIAALAIAIFVEHALVSTYVRMFTLVVPFVYLFLVRATVRVWAATGAAATLPAR
jgi:hypothetical protein